MSHNLFIVDDGFMAPAQRLAIEHYSHFCSATVQLLLGEDWGDEHALKALCTSILSDETEDGKKKWSLTAFTNPHALKKAIAEGNFRADIVIFDWDYSTTAGDDFSHVTYLRELLNSSHVQVYIFSGLDQQDHIRTILATELAQFGDRIQLFDKDNTNDHRDSHMRLQSRIDTLQGTNFAFKFGRDLRAITNQSLDSILHHLSEMDLDKVIAYLGKEKAEPIDYDLKELIGIRIKNTLKESKELQKLLKDKGPMKATRELVEFVSEKIKNRIISWQAPHPAPITVAYDETAMQKLWSYRLYHHPHDQLVRTGDIIRKKNGTDSHHLYLVLTPLCQLEHFWGKTHGHLNVVRLYEIEGCKGHLKAQALLTKKAATPKGGDVTSIANGISKYGGDPLYMPFIEIDGAVFNYLLFPKEIDSIKTELPAAYRVPEGQQKKDPCLDYAMEGFEYERITTISDPFVGPIIDHVFATLKGYGAPDFPKELKTKLTNHYQGIFA